MQNVQLSHRWRNKGGLLNELCLVQSHFESHGLRIEDLENPRAHLSYKAPEEGQEWPATRGPLSHAYRFIPPPGAKYDPNHHIYSAKDNKSSAIPMASWCASSNASSSGDSVKFKCFPCLNADFSRSSEADALLVKQKYGGYPSCNVRSREYTHLVAF